MAPRTSVTAACTLAAAALLLTACGGGGSSTITPTTSSGTAAGAPSGGTTPPATTTAAAPAGAPTFDFPPDVKVVVDPDTTGDAVKDAILRDQGYGLQAIYLARAKLDTTIPVFSRYLTQEAALLWSNGVNWGRKYHRSVTGTVRFYDREVSVRDQKTAGITFCEDQRYSYDKDSKTGKVFTTKPSANSFIFHTAQMVKAPDGTWQMANYKSQRGAARCRR